MADKPPQPSPAVRREASSCWPATKTKPSFEGSPATAGRRGRLSGGHLFSVRTRPLAGEFSGAGWCPLASKWPCGCRRRIGWRCAPRRPGSTFPWLNCVVAGCIRTSNDCGGRHGLRDFPGWVAGFRKSQPTRRPPRNWPSNRLAPPETSPARWHHHERRLLHWPRDMHGDTAETTW